MVANDWLLQNGDYAKGYEAGMQRALDIVCGASDWLQKHPEHKLDVFDILARIITDIQIAGEKHG